MDLKKIVFLDIECYKNYFLVMFKRLIDGKTIYFESFNNSKINHAKLESILNRHTVVTFNGTHYDEVIIDGVMSGYTNEKLYKLSCKIIAEGLPHWTIRDIFGLSKVKFDHVDLKEVAPLVASLKIYGGRLHAPKMQELPIDPHALIRSEDLQMMRKYCLNDLDVTELLYKHLEEDIKLRVTLGEEYGLDLRSKSDAQIAEAVFRSEVTKATGAKPKPTGFVSGEKLYYQAPKNIRFKTKECNSLFELFKSLPIVINEKGSPQIDFKYHINKNETVETMLKWVETKKGKTKENWLKLIAEDENKAFKKYKKSLKVPKHKFEFKGKKYTFGLGGIHSCEKSQGLAVSEDEVIQEWDVASYYPNIIVNNGFYPDNLGTVALDIYSGILRRRLAAKKSGDRVMNECFKIIINGFFGKLGSPWSILYAPQLLTNVTITGQLTLLMLIERFELAGISVVSANTDGVVIHTSRDNGAKVEAIVKEWQEETGFDLENTNYKALYSRDINNYIALKENDTFKTKGAYADNSVKFNTLRKNPTGTICIDAIKNKILSGEPIEDTVKSCEDITKFLVVRKVNGGAIKHGKPVGSSIRWYYSDHELDPINYLKSGNKVPKSDGAIVLMDIPEQLPEDVDLWFYIKEAEDMLKDVGYKNN